MKKKSLLEKLNEIGEVESFNELDGDYPPEMDDDSVSSEECPKCGGTHTHPNESIPSMMGYGSDESLHCDDCNKDFSVDPLHGGYAGHPERRFESNDPINFDRFMDRIVVQESKRRTAPLDETPQRKHARLYREQYQNSIRFGRTK